MKLKRVIASALCVSILATNCLFAHARETGIWEERRASIQLASLAPSILNAPSATRPNLPYALGTVRSIRHPAAGPSRKTVIVIQDVHMNREAQSNISAVIAGLAKSHGIDYVALEGTANAISVTSYRKADKNDLASVADFLLQENKISGAVHAALTMADSPPDFFGVEDAALYDRNVQAYLSAQPFFNLELRALSSEEKRLLETGRGVLNPALREFDEWVRRYRDKRIELGAYLDKLSRYEKPSPGLSRFVQAARLESAIDFSQVAKDRSTLLTALTPRLSPSEIESVVQAGIAYRLSTVRANDFYGRLAALSELKGIRVRNYPSLRQYVEYVRLADEIDGASIFDEMRRMEESVYLKLTRDEQEKKIIDGLKFNRSARKLLSFSLTPSEWADYLRLKKSAGRTALDHIAPFETFYEVAKLRDAAIARHFIEKSAGREAGTGVLVVGGFHSKAVETALNAAGFTTVSFVPRLSNVSQQGENGYLSVFAQDKTPLERLVMGEKIFLPPDPASGLRLVPVSLSLLKQAWRALALAPRVTVEKIIPVTGGSVRIQEDVTRDPKDAKKAKILSLKSAALRTQSVVPSVAIFAILNDSLSPLLSVVGLVLAAAFLAWLLIWLLKKFVSYTEDWAGDSSRVITRRLGIEELEGRNTPSGLAQELGPVFSIPLPGNKNILDDNAAIVRSASPEPAALTQDANVSALDAIFSNAVPSVPARVAKADALLLDIGPKEFRTLRFSYTDPLTLNQTLIEYAYESSGTSEGPVVVRTNQSGGISVREVANVLLKSEVTTVTNSSGAVIFKQVLNFPHDANGKFLGFDGKRDYSDSRGEWSIRTAKLDSRNRPLLVIYTDKTGVVQETDEIVYNDANGSMTKLIKPRAGASETLVYGPSSDPQNPEVRPLREIHRNGLLITLKVDRTVLQGSSGESLRRSLIGFIKQLDNGTDSYGKIGNLETSRIPRQRHGNGKGGGKSKGKPISNDASIVLVGASLHYGPDEGTIDIDIDTTPELPPDSRLVQAGNAENPPNPDPNLAETTTVDGEDKALDGDADGVTTGRNETIIEPSRLIMDWNQTALPVLKILIPGILSVGLYFTIRYTLGFFMKMRWRWILPVLLLLMAGFSDPPAFAPGNPKNNVTVVPRPPPSELKSKVDQKNKLVAKAKAELAQKIAELAALKSDLRYKGIIRDSAEEMDKLTEELKSHDPRPILSEIEKIKQHPFFVPETRVPVKRQNESVKRGLKNKRPPPVRKDLIARAYDLETKSTKSAFLLTTNPELKHVKRITTKEALLELAAKNLDLLSEGQVRILEDLREGAKIVLHEGKLYRIEQTIVLGDQRSELTVLMRRVKAIEEKQNEVQESIADLQDLIETAEENIRPISEEKSVEELESEIEKQAQDIEAEQSRVGELQKLAEEPAPPPAVKQADEGKTENAPPKTDLKNDAAPVWLEHVINTILFSAIVFLLHRLVSLYKSKKKPLLITGGAKTPSESKPPEKSGPTEVKGKAVLLKTGEIDLASGQERLQLERVQYKMKGSQHQHRFRYHTKKSNPHLVGLLRRHTVTKLDVNNGAIEKTSYEQSYGEDRRLLGYTERRSKTFLGYFYKRDSIERPDRFFVYDVQHRIMAVGVLRFLSDKKIRLFLFKSLETDKTYQDIEKRIDSGENSDKDVVFNAPDTIEDLYRRIFNRAVDTLSNGHEGAVTALYRSIEGDKPVKHLVFSTQEKSGEVEHTIFVVSNGLQNELPGSREVNIYHRRHMNGTELSPTTIISQAGHPNERIIYEPPIDPLNPVASIKKRSSEWEFKEDGSVNGLPDEQVYNVDREIITRKEAAERQKQDDRAVKLLAGSSPLHFSEGESEEKRPGYISFDGMLAILISSIVAVFLWAWLLAYSLPAENFLSRLRTALPAPEEKTSPLSSFWPGLLWGLVRKKERNPRQPISREEKEVEEVVALLRQLAQGLRQKKIDVASFDSLLGGAEKLGVGVLVESVGARIRQKDQKVLLKAIVRLYRNNDALTTSDDFKIQDLLKLCLVDSSRAEADVSWKRVVIPMTEKDEKTIRKLLARAPEGSKFVLVMDERTTDKLADLIKTYRKRIRLIIHKETAALFHFDGSRRLVNVDAFRRSLSELPREQRADYRVLIPSDAAFRMPVNFTYKTSIFNEFEVGFLFENLDWAACPTQNLNALFLAAQLERRQA